VCPATAAASTMETVLAAATLDQEQAVLEPSAADLPTGGGGGGIGRNYGSGGGGGGTGSGNGDGRQRSQRSTMGTSADGPTPIRKKHLEP
jgi:hypothetical protein